METKIILSAPPEYYAQAKTHCQTIAHMAYQIGEDFHLYRTSIPLSLKGGLMVLGDKTYSNSADPETLTGEIIKECIFRGFDGVILAFEQSTSALHSLTGHLAERLSRQGGALYLPEDYAQDSDWATVMISTAISGGSLTARLQESAAAYGRARMCLDIERVRMDFCLPSRDGNGKPITPRELYVLTKTYNPQPYFSQELCAYYFTFKDEHGSHFVLYDDAGSIRKKIQLAARLGISSAMLFYPEVEDILSSGGIQMKAPWPEELLRG